MNEAIAVAVIVAGGPALVTLTALTLNLRLFKSLKRRIESIERIAKRAH